MKQFIKLLFLLFSIGLKAAEARLQFTNFCPEAQLQGILDDLVEIACAKDSENQVEKIYFMFNKIYSSDIEQINELLAFLEIVEKEALYREPAQYAKKIIKEGLSRMRAHEDKLRESQIKPLVLKKPKIGVIIENYIGGEQEYDWHIPTFDECNRELEFLDLGLSEQVIGSINKLELLIQTTKSSNVKFLIRQIISQLKNSTLDKTFFREMINKLEKNGGLSAEIEALDEIFFSLFGTTSEAKHAMINVNRIFEEGIVINNVIKHLRSSLEKAAEDSELSELIQQIITELEFGKENDFGCTKAILEALKENVKIQKDLILALDELNKL